MVTAPQPPAGRLVDGRYRLGAILGSGGMATVHRARDTRLERAVALKLYRPNTDRGAQQRFHEEARTLAGLTHPGLVAVYDFGTDDGEPYLVLQLVDGETLRDRMSDGPISPREVLELGARLAATLAHVHSGGVIHRDIKPSNVLLDRDGAPYLADFGVSLLAHAARLTATGQVLGTAAYLAPEQVLGGPIDPAADVYALGLVLLECLTGRTEYDGNGVETAVARLYREPRIPADVPPELASLLAAMTRLDPAARPTAADCAAVLTRPAPVSAPLAASTDVAGATPVSTPAAHVSGSTPHTTAPPASGSLHQAARRSATRVLAALPLASAAPTAARPVPNARRLPAVAAAATLVVAAMTWTLLASAAPSASTPDETAPTERSQVGVIPARQPAPTTTPPPQVITEIVTVVVPRPAEQPAPAAPKGKGKKPKGDDDDEDDDD